MKIVVSPSYKHLSEFISDIPNRNYKCDELFMDSRNVVEKITAPDGTELVVKRYKRPTRANQIIYTFLRWSKPKRSYIFAQRLEKLGIKTAEQAAYIETFKWGIFHTGYSITRFIPDKRLEKVNDLHTEKREAILHAFAEFTLDLHLKGIKHGDYNANNIFYRHENGRFCFTLIDINRMQFRRKIPDKDCMREFQRLLSRKDMITVAERYAELRGWNIDVFCGAILMARGFNIIGKLKEGFRAAIKAVRLLAVRRRQRDY